MIAALCVNVSASSSSRAHGSLQYIASEPTSVPDEASTGNDQQPRSSYSSASEVQACQRGSFSTSEVMTGWPVATAAAQAQASGEVSTPRQ